MMNKMPLSDLSASDLEKILIFAAIAVFALLFWKVSKRRSGTPGEGSRRRFKPGAKPPYRPRARKHWKKQDGKGDGNDIDTGGGDGGE